MGLIVTPMHETGIDHARDYVRISNDQGDTIDLGVAGEQSARLLAIALNEDAETLTIVEVWDSSPHP